MRSNLRTYAHEMPAMWSDLLALHLYTSVRRTITIGGEMNQDQVLHDCQEERRQLVEALKVAIEVADLHPQHEKYAARWRELLRNIGEEVPPLED
jgi:hypothetical protein